MRQFAAAQDIRWRWRQLLCKRGSRLPYLVLFEKWWGSSVKEWKGITAPGGGGAVRRNDSVFKTPTVGSPQIADIRECRKYQLEETGFIVSHDWLFYFLPIVSDYIFHSVVAPFWEVGLHWWLMGEGETCWADYDPCDAAEIQRRLHL